MHLRSTIVEQSSINPILMGQTGEPGTGNRRGK
jgi:hypothetical protein